MIAREITAQLLEAAQTMPIVSVTGPRQSGKTTLVRNTFPTYMYLSFEDPDTRAAFEDDPRAFLARYHEHVIFDEAQRMPSLFSYLQGIVDAEKIPGQFILTGSQNFLLMKGISQSLAGRVALLTLLPLSLHELQQAGFSPQSASEWLIRGGYPRLFDSEIPAVPFFSDYTQTYLERDIRVELGVKRLSAFRTLLELCALRSGDLLNIASLARDCGVAPATAREWLSLLEASHMIYLLRPYAKNRTKRLVKSPKLYFIDTGLAAYLMGIESPDDLYDGGETGRLFKTAVVSELLKRLYAARRTPMLSFWRDSNGNEIDILIERGARVLQAIECKSSTTYSSRFFDGLTRIGEEELGLSAEHRAVVYGGEDNMSTARGKLVSYREIGSLIVPR